MPSHYNLAILALNKKGFKGSFFITTDGVDNSATWNKWRDAANQGHEVGSHTKSHPRLPDLSLTEMEEEIGESRAIIDGQITTQECLTFVYPFGRYDSNAKTFARDYYIAARGILCDFNKTPYDFYGMRGCEDSTSLEEMKSYTDEAEQQGHWLITFHHNLDGTGYGFWTIDTFIAFLGHLETKDLWVGTFGSVVKYIKERETANLSLISNSDNKIVLNLTDTLDDTVFDQPLTIRSEVPSSWTMVLVQQGSNTITATPFVEGTQAVIYYNAVPDRGFITLQDLSTNQFTLTATKTGSGSGTPTASGLTCVENTCTGIYNYGDRVQIAANPGTDSVFGEWVGCDSTADKACTVLINGDRNVTVSFYSEYTCVVTLGGTGDGKVTSTPSGIDCESTCSGTFVIGTQILLSAKPSDGSVFAYWSGACSGTTDTCDFTITDYVGVTAHFTTENTQQYALKIKEVKKNNGDGAVTSNDRNITCGDICSYKYYQDTVITLSATANEGSTFIGWKPDTLECVGTDPCTVTIDKAKTIQAIFAGDYTLKVTAQSKKGGTGLVSSTPSGISCFTGSKEGCAASYPYALPITLSASPDEGSTFLGWAPATLRQGTGVCIVTNDKKRRVKAVFLGP